MGGDKEILTDRSNSNISELVTKPRENSNIINLSQYRIKKSLETRGFEIVSDKEGKFRLIFRITD